MCLLNLEDTVQLWMIIMDNNSPLREDKPYKYPTPPPNKKDFNLYVFLFLG